MPRMMRDASTAPTTHGTFVGRVRELKEFRNSVRYLLGKEPPPDNSPLYPHIHLPHGEGGMGKSALLQQFLRIAVAEGFDRERIIVVKLDYEEFPTAETLAQTLVDEIRRSFPDFDHVYQLALTRRGSLDKRYRDLRALWVRWEDQDEEELEEILAGYKTSARHLERQRAMHGIASEPQRLAFDAHQTNQDMEKLEPLVTFRHQHGRLPESFDELLQQEFGSEDAKLFQGDFGLGKAFGDDLYRLAEKKYLLVAIDTYERADKHDDWL